MSKPSFAILTLCVGADYRKAMEPGIESKRAYAAKHRYTFHCGGEDVWDRSRPIPWSKFKFILKHLDNYDYIFWSDADAIILNMDTMLETQIVPLLPPEKDILWTRDACNNLNNGHLLIRGRSAWVRDYLQRAFEQTDLTYHIWWDNAAMIRLYETVPSDAKKIATINEHWLFNAYIFGKDDTANCKASRLYKPGDFIVHFAGVYDIWNIYRMMIYIQYQLKHNLSINTLLLDYMRNNPPRNKVDADTYLSQLLEHK